MGGGGGGTWVNVGWVCDPETSIQGTPSGPSHMSPQWGLGLGLFIINQQIKYFFFHSASESAAVYFKQLVNV